MQRSRLFQALVVGGALMVSGQCKAPQQKTKAVPPATSNDQKESTIPGITNETGQQTFCDPKNTNQCVEGKAVEGVVCCWGTSC